MNNTKIADFQADLARGKQAETRLVELWPALEILPGKKSDFVNNSTGELVQLKCDYYGHDNTKNFFMERYSSIEARSPGGPYQSLEHGSSLFLYWFAEQKFLYAFNTKELVEQLDLITADLPLIQVRNKAWVTGGYKVPRESLEPIYKIIELPVAD